MINCIKMHKKGSPSFFPKKDIPKTFFVNFYNPLISDPGSQSFGMPPSIPAIASAAALTNVQVVPTEGCIIHLVVERAIYSITLDTLYQIFSR